MKLNHLDVPVSDTKAVASFFESNFAFRRIFERDDGLIVLLDEGDFALTLSAMSAAGQLPQGFHVGFNVESEEIVHSLYRHFEDDGVPLCRALDHIGGALSFQCLAPGGLVVEVAWRQP